MKTFHKVATIHYIRGSQMFHTNLVKKPALFLLSNSDPIGAFSSNMRVRESWESMGIPVSRFCINRNILLYFYISVIKYFITFFFQGTLEVLGSFTPRRTFPKTSRRIQRRVVNIPRPCFRFQYR